MFFLMFTSHFEGTPLQSETKFYVQSVYVGRFKINFNFNDLITKGFAF